MLVSSMKVVDLGTSGEVQTTSIAINLLLLPRLRISMEIARRKGEESNAMVKGFLSSPPSLGLCIIWEGHLQMNKREENFSTINNLMVQLMEWSRRNKDSFTRLKEVFSKLTTLRKAQPEFFHDHARCSDLRTLNRIELLVHKVDTGRWKEEESSLREYLQKAEKEIVTTMKHASECCSRLLEAEELVSKCRVKQLQAEHRSIALHICPMTKIQVC
ncbi:uncharacterized protein G2W53_000763 [Senna tora]|uniref:Uncharacterized protein n=1 Tax=Senna tora TaxID=362788 RepID=A0A834XG07_9FABA|nr:uncharacterized protein G2W53_000763 [Senna tora]